MRSRKPDLNHPEPSGVDEEGASAEEAFDRFVKERYGRLVSTIAVITRDRDVAEDLAQETFAKAHLHWSKLWPEGNPGGWVHRVATNLALSRLRRLGRELRAVQRLGRSTAQTVPEPEAYPEVHRAVAGLPAKQRAAVALHYAMGLPVKEVAEAMGVAEGTVKSLLYRARERLREELGESA